MKRAAILAAVVACYGCQTVETDAPGRAEAAGPMASLVNRVSARTDSTGLPGVMRIFLSDSTLVMDSCWETYHLVRWRALSDSVLAWQEGTVEVRDTIPELAGETLMLRVDLVNGSQDERYRAAAVPYLCPDMRR
jgi:hypothetical protein